MYNNNNNQQQKSGYNSGASSSSMYRNNQNTEEMNLKMLMNAVPGVPGEDYPILERVPRTDFSCQGKVAGGK